MLNNNLEQQAMALFKSWFIDFEPFDGQVPKTWVNGVLGDFVEIKRGGSPRPIQNFLSDSGFHWLKISDATSISSPFINEIKEYIIEAGLKKTVYLKSGSLVLSNSATPGLSVFSFLIPFLSYPYQSTTSIKVYKLFSLDFLTCHFLQLSRQIVLLS